jgi:DNA-binding transcriptional ArsR family regulator
MDSISNTFSALADPTRRAILARLALGESSVTELAAPFEMSMPAVSKHLRVLERAGLVERGREAQFRPCRLRAHPLEQAAGWLEQYRRFWEESFDRLDEYLQRLQSEQKSPPKSASGRRPKAAKTSSLTTGNSKITTKENHEKRNGPRSKKHA